MKNSFYVALTSDKSLEQFPQNKAAEFKMQLPRQMHQSENWEVAMTAERAAWQLLWWKHASVWRFYRWRQQTSNMKWRMVLAVVNAIYEIA